MRMTITDPKERQIMLLVSSEWQVDNGFFYYHGLERVSCQSFSHFRSVLEWK